MTRTFNSQNTAELAPTSCQVQRISAAALCAITIDGCLLVEINRNRRDILTPLGGALQATPSGLDYLRDLGAVFESAPDLRFRVPPSAVAACAAWFEARRDRELDPHRELAEELGQEHGLLPGPFPELPARLLRTRSFVEPTSRPGIPPVSTLYLHEIFSVELTPTLAAAARLAARNPESRLRLLPTTPLPTHFGGFQVATSVLGLVLDQ